MNGGEESIWVTLTAGDTWIDMTGDIEAATSTIAKARPTGLLFVPFPEFNASALLVGTVSGVYVTWTDPVHQGLWARVGQCQDLPLVLTKGLQYNPYDDTIVAATLGRGVYTLHNARSHLANIRHQQDQANCGLTPPRQWDPLPYWPPQKSC